MKLFGTDGIRGRANKFPLIPEFITLMGRAIPKIFDSKESVIIGGDSRESTGMISSALSAGLTSAGVNVIVANVIPTPILAFLVKNYDGVSCGLMVSASHNPWYDNGIKFFNSDGEKLTKKQEEKFEEIIFSLKPDDLREKECGKVFNLLNWQEHYVKWLQSIFELDLSEIKIVIDLANGAATSIVPQIMSSFKCTPIMINDEPSGRKINENCGAEHPENLSESVLNENADIGICLDGDADRVILIDEKGQVVDGDAIIGIIADYEKAKGVVVTQHSNLGLVNALKEKHIDVKIADVGDRNVAELMRSSEYNIGGEKSGHIILSDYETTGNGILVALKVLEIMKSSGKKLSELNFVKETPQVLINVEVEEKTPLDKMPLVKRIIEETEEILGDNGRVLFRYSGTQSLARVMVEAQSKHEAQAYARRIVEALKCKE